MRAYILNLEAAKDRWAALSGAFERIGFPVTPTITSRVRHTNGGTWLAAQLAMQHGYAANSAAGELLSRRLLQIEAATRRNPRQPDFEGLDGIFDVALDEGGSAILPRFTEWVGKQQQAEASVLKAGRQWREEQTSIKKKERGKGAGKAGADDA